MIVDQTRAEIPELVMSGQMEEKDSLVVVYQVGLENFVNLMQIVVMSIHAATMELVQRWDQNLIVSVHQVGQVKLVRLISMNALLNRAKTEVYAVTLWEIMNAHVILFGPERIVTLT